MIKKAIMQAEARSRLKTKGKAASIKRLCKRVAANFRIGHHQWNSRLRFVLRLGLTRAAEES